jgi:hypothetical protein
MKRSLVMFTGAMTLLLATGALATSPAMADSIPLATSHAQLLVPVANAMQPAAVSDAGQPAAHLELAQWDGRRDGRWEGRGGWRHHRDYNRGWHGDRWGHHHRHFRGHYNGY